MTLLLNKTFTFENIQISIYGTKETPMFIGNEIASLLKFSRPRDAIHDHVWKENKITVKEYEEKNNCVLNIEQKKTYLINEPAVYQLIFSSKLERAKELQRWVFNIVLPEIRKTGQFTMKKPEHNQIVLMNEFDLHTQIVNFIRRI